MASCLFVCFTGVPTTSFVYRDRASLPSQSLSLLFLFLLHFTDQDLQYNIEQKCVNSHPRKSQLREQYPSVSPVTLKFVINAFNMLIINFGKFPSIPSISNLLIFFYHLWVSNFVICFILLSVEIMIFLLYFVWGVNCIITFPVLIQPYIPRINPTW